MQEVVGSGAGGIGARDKSFGLSNSRSVGGAGADSDDRLVTIPDSMCARWIISGEGNEDRRVVGEPIDETEEVALKGVRLADGDSAGLNILEPGEPDGSGGTGDSEGEGALVIISGMLIGMVREGDFGE